MNCTEAGNLEPLYRSGELDPKTMAEIDFHLGMCSSCAQQWKEQDRLDVAVRESVRAMEVDPTPVVDRVRKQMQLSLGEPIRWRLSAWVAVAGIAVAVLILSIVLTRRTTEPGLFVDAAEDHSAEVVAHEPRDWVRGQTGIDQLVQRELATAGLVNALAPAGYHIDRAKVCELLGQHYVHLVYSNGGREVSFFARRRDGERVPGETVQQVNGIRVRAGQARGLQVAGFQASRLTILVVSDTPRDEAVQFAAHAAGQV
jgi:anti-sigma factor RsiW